MKNKSSPLEKSLENYINNGDHKRDAARPARGLQPQEQEVVFFLFLVDLLSAASLWPN